MSGRAIHNLSLPASKIDSLDEQGELVQRAAKAMPGATGLQAIDPHVPLRIDPQLDSLITRVNQHIKHVLGERKARQIEAVGSGVDDASSALTLVIGAIDAQRTREYTALEKADIARRSFGVVHSYAMARPLRSKELTLIEEPVGVVVRSAGEGALYREYDAMPCPAFRGSPTGIPRMPAQLWPKIIEIYQVCGEFGPSEEQN